MNDPYGEWKKNNPNGSLNDFYAVLGINQTVPYTRVKAGFPLMEEEEPTYISLIMGCAAGVFGLLGHFTPWFSIPMLNISISGNEIKQLVVLLNSFTDMTHGNSIGATLSGTQKNARLDIILNIMAFIPFVYIAMILGSLIKSYVITIISCLFNLAIIGFLAYFLISVPQMTSFMSIGIYLICLSGLITIYNLFTLKF